MRLWLIPFLQYMKIHEIHESTIEKKLNKNWPKLLFLTNHMPNIVSNTLKKGEYFTTSKFHIIFIGLETL
jgi:hypothetical protein